MSVPDSINDDHFDSELVHSQGLCTFQGPLSELIRPDISSLAQNAANDELRPPRSMETLSGRHRPVETEYYVTAVAFSSNGHLQASAGWDAGITLRDSETGKKLHILKAHQNRVNVLAFSPDNRMLVSAGQDRRLIFWELASGRPLKIFHNLSAVITAMAFSPDGYYLATGARNGSIRLWSPREKVAGYDQYGRPCLVCDPKVMYTLFQHRDEVSALAFSPNGRQLASGSHDRNIFLWTFKSRWRFRLAALFGSNKPTKRFTWHLGAVTSLTFHPNGDKLVSGGEDNLVKCFETTTGQLMRTIRKHKAPIVTVAFSRDENKNLIVGSRDGIISIWNMVSGQCLNVLKSDAHRLNAIHLAANGNFQAAGQVTRTMQI